MDLGSNTTPLPIIGRNQDISTWPELPSPLIDPITGRQFIVGKLIGKGGFAKCYECTDLSTGQKYCCKAVYDPKGACPVHQIQMESETAILQKLNHPNVVGYEMRFFASGFMCLILELCSHGTLLKLLRRRKRLIEAEARVLTLHFIAALSYLQKQGVLHRDLKLANLLLADGPNGGVVLKLGDFGLAVQLEAQTDQRRWTLCGTPNFIAPEVVDSHCSDGYGYAADVWSLGIVLYIMLVGSMPFTSSTREMLFSKIQACDFEFPLNRTVSFRAKDLIRFILKKDPVKRPSLEAISRHPFFIPGPTALPLISLSRIPTPHEMACPNRKPLTLCSKVDNRGGFVVWIFQFCSFKA